MQKINLVGPINQLGYGVAFSNIVKTFYQQKYEYSLWPIGPIDVFQKETADAVQFGINNQDNYDKDATCIKVWHQNQMAERVGCGKFIGFTFFELDELNKKEKHHLSQLDKIVVASNWAREVCINNGLDSNKIVVAPLGVDTTIFSPDIAMPSLPNTVSDKTTVFLNCGKWEYRKGHDVILDAFNKAFEPSDDVFLIMNCYNPILGEAYSKDWEYSYLSSKMGRAGKIYVFKQRLQSQYEVASLMNRADCGIFLSRAEGWGLESAEMLAMGKNVIMTNYSAHTEYILDSGAIPVYVDKMESAYDGSFFHGFGQWASLDESQINQCVDHMRIIHNKKQNGDDLTNKDGIKAFAEKFTWQKCVEKLINEQI